MEERCVFYKKDYCGDHKVSKKSDLYHLKSAEISGNKQ